MKKFFTLFAAGVLALAAQANQLTICEGQYYSNTSPICGLYADTEGTMTQSIYPADMLAEMNGGKITEVTFYTLANYYEMNGQTSVDPTDYINFEGAKLQLSLLEVDEMGFTEVVAVTGATAVATTVPEFGEIEVNFVLDEPFTYTGKNLLVEVSVAEAGEWGQTYFYGAGVEGYNCAYYFVDGEADLSSFLPKVTFDYDEAGDEPIDPENPYAEGYWLMIMDMNGNPVPYQLLPGDNGDYTTTVALNYNVFGPVDPQADERPMVPFYFLVNGVRYGAEQGEQVANLGQALENPLYDANGFYTIPVGYNYNIGIAFGPQGDMYAYVAQAGYTSIDELNAKSVAGVRYYNLAGQEMQEANGLTIVVTTYTDGTTSAVKVVK